VSLAELAHQRHTKPLRLGGPGPLVGRDQETWAARHLFLSAIEDYCPDALASLCTDVLPAYQADDGSYDGSLLRWATRWNLTKDAAVPQWLCSQVHLTLRFWDPYPGTREGWHELFPPGVWVGRRWVPDPDELLIGLSGIGEYGDTTETPADIRKRWYAEALAAIDSHLDRVRVQAEMEGLEEPKEVSRRHYLWTVRFQVGGEHVPSIVETTERVRHCDDGKDRVVNVDERSVRFAIRDVLDQVGIDRRTERPGPKPPKARRTSRPSHRVAEV